MSAIPAFVNTESGTSQVGLDVLRGHEAFAVHACPASEIGDAVRAAVAGGARRILVSGGDGTIAIAASLLMDTDVELAILPGGTLNHFARDLGIAANADEALRVAASGAARAVAVGMVNGRLFLNTSSVGAYVRFVRLRESLERRRVGYRLASALAALRIVFQFRLIVVRVKVDGRERIYRTPLVFIGVGERELKLPMLGNRVADGRQGLHVMVVRGRTRARAVAIGLAAVARGVRTAAQTPEFDSFLVEQCTISRRHRGDVALDGELESLDATLHYESRLGALRVVCP